MPRLLGPLVAAIILVACTPLDGNEDNLDLTSVVEPGAWTFLFALPDGSASRLAILGFDATHHLRVAFTVEGKIRQLSQRGLEVSDIAWMPDERLLVALGDSDMSTDLAFMDPTDGSIGDRLDVDWDRVVDFHSMDVSPDGTTAIIAAREPGPTESPSDLYLVDLDTGHAQSVSNTVGTYELSPTFIDSETIAYVEGESTVDTDAPNGAVRTLDLNTGKARVISEPSFVAVSVAAAQQSHDIVYNGFPLGDRGSQGIWLVSGGDEEPMSIAAGPLSYPALDAAGGLLVITKTSSGEILSAKMPH